MSKGIRIILWDRIIRVDWDGPGMHGQNDKLVKCVSRVRIKNASQAGRSYHGKYEGKYGSIGKSSCAYAKCSARQA